MAAVDQAETKKVLLVGLLCLDVVNTCDHYPQEDEDMRAISSSKVKGGNASNSAGILAQLNHSPLPTPHKVHLIPHLLASVADDSEAK